MSYSELSSAACISLARAGLHGAVFIMIVWMVCLVLPKLSDSARCGLWWLASAKLLLGLALSISISVAIPVLPPKALQNFKIPLGVSAAFAANEFDADQRPHYHIGSSGDSGPTPTQGNSDTAARSMAWPTPAEALFGIWALAVMFRIGYLCRALMVLRQCIARSTPLEDTGHLQIAQEVARTFGITRIPRLRVSNTVTDPLLCGLFRKVILFSAADIASLSPAEFRLVFAHECAHLKRRDLLLSLVPALTQTIYWFFPPSWLVCSEFEATREAACDAAALIALKAEAGVYGRLLLKLSSRPERLDPLSLAGALGVSSHLKLLKRRITMLQFRSPYSRRRALTGVIVVSFSGLFGVVPWRVVAANTDGSAKRGQGERQESRASVPTPQSDSVLPDKPTNLDFAQGSKGWEESTHDGDEPYFASGLDASVKRSGVPSPYLACNSDRKGVYGVLTQWINAVPYRGKRVRFSGFIKTASIHEYGGLMFCLNSDANYEYYDMRTHGLRGDHDWTHVEYVADVATDRVSFTIGMNLQGRGTVWMDALKFEVVGKDVALTPAYHTSSSGSGLPQNLGFAQGLTHWSRGANGGDAPNPYYEVGLDHATTHNGAPAAYLKSSVPDPQGYGVLRQDASAGAYHGKRIRFSAYLRTKGIEKYSGLLLAIFSPSGNHVWAMAKQPIVGTTDWKRYEFVVDVPRDAGLMMFGTSIQGKGAIYAADFNFETVGKDVPVTTGETAP